LLSPPVATCGSRKVRERHSGQREADGFERSDGAAAGGFDDGADVGIELGSPFGRRDVAVGDEDEQDAAGSCGLPFGLLAASSDALRPCEGGVLELSGVFGSVAGSPIGR